MKTRRDPLWRALQSIDQRRRSYPDRWSRSAYRNIARHALQERDAARAEADHLRQQLREVMEGRVCGVWHDRVSDEHVVTFNGPWVIESESLLGN